MSSDRAAGRLGKRAIHIQDMFSLDNVGGLSVSPNGKFVAFQSHRANLEQNSYEVAWYILNLTDKAEAPVHVGRAGDPLLFRAKGGNRINGAWRSPDPVWSPDSQWIAYRRMDKKSVQIWRSSVDGRIQEQISHSNASVEAFDWSGDGQHIWFETDATPQEQEDYRQSQWEHGLWASHDYYYPESNSLISPPYNLTRFEPRLWIQELVTSKARPASDAERQRHFASKSVLFNTHFARLDRSTQIPGRRLSRSAAVSVDGVQLAWVQLETKAFRPNGRVHASTGIDNNVEVPCEFSVCFGLIGQLWWNRDGRELIFSRREGSNDARTVFYAWDLRQNTVRKIYTEDSRHLTACSSTGHSLVCFSDEGARPRIIVEVAFLDGSLKELFNPNPQLDEVLLGEAELIDWPNAFGIKTVGWLIKPIDYERGKRYPLVIVQYRARRCFMGGVGSEYPAHLFAAAGFVVLCFDQPTLGGVAQQSASMTDYEQAIWKDYMEQRVVLASLESAIDLLDDKQLIDPTRVGITGLSAGADTISYALSHSNRFAAAIAASLGWSPMGYFFAPETLRKMARDTGFGRPGTPEDRYWSGMSLGMNASQVHTPLLTQVSDNEATRSMFNYVTLKEEGKPIDMYVFQDEYHVKWHPRNRKAVAARSVDWMRFWLKGEVDTDTAKTEQYAHWRVLCEQHVGNLGATADPELRRRAESQPCSETIH